MEELSFSSLAKKGRDEIEALKAPPAPEPVVEAPKAAATPDVKQEKKEDKEKEATPVPAATPTAAATPAATATPAAPTAAPAAATPTAETPPV